jgi:disulfide oxidoreductase YuzD
MASRIRAAVAKDAMEWLSGGMKRGVFERVETFVPTVAQRIE